MALKKFLLPELGEGVTEGEILKIKVKKGDSIAMDQVLLEVMTDKASMEIPSSIEGVIESLEVKEGDIVSVNAPLFTVQIKGEEKPEEEEEEEEEEETKKAEPDYSIEKAIKTENKTDLKTSLAIPSSRKLAEELEIDLKEVKGSGEAGEVKRKDILQYVKQKMNQISTLSSSPLLTEDFEETKRRPVKGIQRLMFESMSLSKATIPHYTIGEYAKADLLVKLRTEMKIRLEKQGLKIGYLPFFIKALIPVLKEFPIFNSLYDSQTKEIIFKKNINFGFAVDSPAGLLVPVLKTAEQKSLLEITKELFELSKKTREGSIEREHLKGSSFTLSNLGRLGGMYGTPIIQVPEMAILGIYKIFKQVVKNKQGDFEEKDFISFSLTCDHRFIDGATAVRFLKSFIQKIEEPSLLLLEE